MSAARAVALTVALSLALVLQTSVLTHVAQPELSSVVPNLVLLVVAAAGLVRGPQFAMVLGFAAGVLLDLAPPADHLAGRWALALVAVGYVAGRLATGFTPSLGSCAAVGAATSFVGTSVFALSGVLLRDPPMATPDLLQVVLISVAFDALLAIAVLPAVHGGLSRLEPERTPA